MLSARYAVVTLESAREDYGIKVPSRMLRGEP